MATIKAGTYRWNDNPDISSAPINESTYNGTTISIPISTPAEIHLNNGMEISFTLSNIDTLFIIPNDVLGIDAPTIIYANNESAVSLGMVYNGETQTMTVNAFAPYWAGAYSPALQGSPYVVWSTQAEEGLSLDGLGKVFNVLEDTSVDDNIATWFEANTEAVVDTPTATVTYNGNAIATITSGQTATIKCKGKVMKDDIVITL